MAKSEYVYTTFIKTTPKKLWEALTTPEFQEKYFSRAHFETSWKKGSDWALMFPNGEKADAGKVLECKPFKRLVLSWRSEWSPEIRKEGFARCEMDLKQEKTIVRLTITHSINRPNSKLIKSVSGGWPFIISNLKSMLETGKVIMKEFF
jgi:uncharacterized protein YndB with AHSA1/START domain